MARGSVMQLKRFQTGFTLLEMLVVLVIIGLLAGLVGPKLFSRLDASKVQTAEVSLPAPALTLPPDPPRIEATAPPAPETTAPQAIAAPVAAVTAAPVASVPTASSSTALPQWSSRIAVLLERNKRYPATARARREEGTTHVAFVLDRQGRLLSSRIEQSSGIPALDQEALDLLRRAQPFPALPAEFADAQISLTVPIKFALR